MTRSDATNKGSAKMTEMDPPRSEAPNGPKRRFGWPLGQAALLHAVVLAHCKKGAMNAVADPRRDRLFTIA